MLLDRRHILRSAAAAALGGGFVAAGAGAALAADRFAASPFRKLTNADWRKRLPPASYNVLREEGTEHPGSSPMAHPGKVRGVYHCLACDLPLFKSEWQFDSGTGWPSFWTAFNDNLGEKRDFMIGFERTEYHCAQCLGHQGHRFDDGPRPTGLRYCNNGVALRFRPG
jgi:peptide-methionine (R)-S-oxide reductase